MTSPYESSATPAGPEWGEPGYGAPSRGQSNGLGTAALVLGILAVLTCWSIVGGIVLGIIAIVLGLIGRGRAKRGEASNGGVATAGTVLGAIGLVLSLVLIAVGATFFFKGGGSDLVNCVSDANGDQARVQQCQQEFANRVNNG